MPHVNDARRENECADMLGNPPPSLEQAGYVNGHRLLDTPNPGQREFQALLLWCLLSPRRSLPWDTKGGRAFQDIEYYYRWVSPQRELIAIGTTWAARVARILLPISTSVLLPAPTSARPASGRRLIRQASVSERRLSGIPGLRISNISKQAIHLVHLPTGGALDLYDPHPSPYASLKDSRLESEVGCFDSLWANNPLTSEEEASLTCWSLARYAPPLSAVMARIELLWGESDSSAELDVNHLNGVPRLSWWAGLSHSELAAMLTKNPIMKVAGARSLPGDGHGQTMLWVDDAALHLRGPQEGRRSGQAQDPSSHA